jgi:hypothetical protein
MEASFVVTNVVPARPDDGADRGPGLWHRLYDDGSDVVTSVRLAGLSRKAGSGLISFAAALLFALGIGLFAVSVNAQYTYVFRVKHAHLVSLIEAISLDAAMAIFSLLALGPARAGKGAGIERALILACALASAGMNYAAADMLSPRSIIAYIAPPLLLAVVVDRVVAVMRRHVLGDDEASPWRAAGRATLYAVRFVLAPVSTAKGARRALLSAASFPAAPQAPAVEPIVRADQVLLRQPGPVEPVRTVGAAPTSRPKTSKKRPAAKRGSNSGPTKTSRFLEACAAEHGDLHSIALTDVYRISKELAPTVGLHPGSARTALRKAILTQESAR